MSEDEFATSAAAYVLGALPPAERHEFEEHLHECASCMRAVSELAGIPALLRSASLSDLERDISTSAVPDTLLPGLTARVRAHRRRTTMLVGGGVLAAACLLLAALLIVLPGANKIAGTPSVPAMALPQRDDSPVRITASLLDVRWGTRINLECRYKHQSGWGTDQGWQGPAVYSLELTDETGGTQQVASWRGTPVGVTTVDATTSLRKDQIREMRVITADGQIISKLSR